MHKSKGIKDIEKMQKKELKSYISDLEESVKINKELMQNVLMATDPSEGHKTIINKLQLEIDRLSQSLQQANREKYDYLESMKTSAEGQMKAEALMKDKEK